MLRSEKKEFVAQLEEIYRSNTAIIIAHYHGLTVNNISKLRNSLRDEGGSFKIVKNTLARIAANNIGYTDIGKIFKGPVAIAYSSDVVTVAKTMAEFAKTVQSLKIVGGIVDSKVIDQATVEQLSKLLSVDQLRSNIIALIQAPATKLVGVIQAPSSTLARVFQAYSAKD